ncbi:MAG: acetylglutamate kinase [Armatimonadetes bacterium]|nr:acetylglutamate kinase [Armatimonadota bacterium]
MKALLEATPYLRLYQGKTFVIKVGGEAFLARESTFNVLRQVSLLAQLGIKIVLVHGGGPQATETGKRLGHASQFIEGRRVTDSGMLEAMVFALNGTVRAEILAVCRQIGLTAVGVSGMDAGLVTAKKRPAKKGADFGMVGDIQKVDASVLNTLLAAGIMPVVSPICADADGQALNVNADTVAAELAVALWADKLVSMTGAPGILRDPADPSSLVSYTDLAGLQDLEASGVLAAGMNPKAASIRRAIEGGVERVHVIGHAPADALLTEVFTNEGSGTMIVRSVESLEGKGGG